MGDDVLRVFAAAVSASTRPNQSFGRCGSEKFLLILPNAGAEPAAAMLTLVLQTVADLSWNTLPPNFKGTCSAGIATNRDKDTAETLLARADLALYKSKETGPNRVSTR